MASTRNKNTPGNYNIEQTALTRQNEHVTFINGYQGKSYTNHFSGNGLLPGKRSCNELSYNPYDVEGFLFGIGSTNLVNPTTPPVVQLKKLDSLNISDRLPTVVPAPLVMDRNQRPNLL